MSVFTSVSLDEVRDWLADYDIGEVQELKGIAAGITNTNYFVMTAQARYVLTIFESNTFDELPYFVDLMTHLAQHGVLCPAPIVDKSGIALHLLKGKPALIVSCLQGQDIEKPSLQQCQAVATTLAQMHLAGADFQQVSRNQRDEAWHMTTAKQVMSKLSDAQQSLLKTELAYQFNLNLDALPHGVVHGDLFRDNVLFHGEQLGGFIDFYYACHDVLAYDVAIAVNEWCIQDDGRFDDEKLNAFLTAYQAVRPFEPVEQQQWVNLLRRAGLRFWLSRLYDYYFPQAGELTYAKDPMHFERILRQRLTMAA